MANELMATQTEIVVCQPDDMTRLEVKLSDDPVWPTQEQMADWFQRDRSVVSRHIRNAFQEGEVDEANCLHFLQTNLKVAAFPAGVAIDFRGFSGTVLIQFRNWRYVDEETAFDCLGCADGNPRRRRNRFRRCAAEGGVGGRRGRRRGAHADG
ncbi:MAG: hypothetical protein MJ138_01220 [Kiritimatiellae bacterium]|nr:hypothetical protein [Kiritimatiellia bacterium]